MYMRVDETWEKNMRRVVDIGCAGREIRGMKNRMEDGGDLARSTGNHNGSCGELPVQDRARGR